MGYNTTEIEKRIARDILQKTVSGELEWVKDESKELWTTADGTITLGLAFITRSPILKVNDTEVKFQKYVDIISTVVRSTDESLCNMVNYCRDNNVDISDVFE